ncbi:hypothetical protein PMAYCL1PPCAC_04541, partial [Pristionchus mayeri]
FWTFAHTSCGDAISFWLDFIFGCIVCIVVLVLDVICVVNMRRSALVLGNSLDSHERQQRTRREMKFL